MPLSGFGGNNVNVGASSTTPFGRFGRPGVPGTVVLIPGRPGTSPTDFRTFNASTDGFNFAPDNYLATPQERTAVYAQARYNITDNIRFSTTAMINERRSSQQLAAIPFTLGPIFGNTVTVSPQNFFNPFGVGSPAPSTAIRSSRASSSKTATGSTFRAASTARSTCSTVRSRGT